MKTKIAIGDLAVRRGDFGLPGIIRSIEMIKVSRGPDASSAPRFTISDADYRWEAEARHIVHVEKTRLSGVETISLSEIRELLSEALETTPA